MGFGVVIVVVVVDVYLGGFGGDVVLLLGQFEVFVEGGCCYLFFMGDFFYVWVGDVCYEIFEIMVVIDVL